MKIVATIEARMTSSRLPGKVLLPALEKPMLYHLVKRLKSVTSIDEIVLAITINAADDVLIDFAKQQHILFYRGSEEDVMSRVIGAADAAAADLIVEITGDCPIIDPDLVEQTIQMYLHHKAEYVSNAHIPSYPNGMDTQVFSVESLKRSAAMTNDLLDHEHVSLYMRNHPEIFSHVHLIAPPSLHWPSLGLTLDEWADYVLLKKIIENLCPINPLFSCLDTIQLLKQNPDWLGINRHVVRKGNT